MPTILVPAHRDENAVRMARNGARGGERFHLVYEYRQRPNWRRFDAEFRDVVEPLGCELEVFKPVDKVVVYRLESCTHD